MKELKFLLDNYMATDEGRRVYDFFKNLPKTIQRHDNKLFPFVSNILGGQYRNIEWNNVDLYASVVSTRTMPIHSMEDFESFFESFVDYFSKKYDASHREMLEDIGDISLALLGVASGFAFPYFFYMQFNKLIMICNGFDIPIAKTPKEKVDKANMLYYLKICKNLYEFRMRFSLSNVELWTFLYGFAPKFLDEYIVDKIPQPHKVWICASDKESQDYLDSDFSENEIAHWSGNVNMQIGDIVMIYVLRPKSAVTHIWQTLSDGCRDPFWKYRNWVALGKPLRIPPVSFADMKANPVLAKSSFIRMRMQSLGSRGYAMKAEEYANFLHILQEKCFDTAILPELLSHNLVLDAEILNERDVEEHLLEPFLVKLGIHAKHITRQMPLRMGRGVRYYPDYVINAKSDRGEERGAFVWEAKYRITSQKQMLEDFYQAKSYALRLNTNGLGLVSYEGIWLSFKGDAWDIKKIQHVRWLDLKNPDTFGQISTALKKAFGKL